MDELHRIFKKSKNFIIKINEKKEVYKINITHPSFAELEAHIKKKETSIYKFLGYINDLYSKQLKNGKNN